VKPSDIDGWYAVNGWFQYAHPEDAARDVQGDVIVPGVNAGPDSVLMPYRISNTPIPGWSQFEAIPYRRRLRWSCVPTMLSASRHATRVGVSPAFVCRALKARQSLPAPTFGD
jgi:hypothetical protein